MWHYEAMRIWRLQINDGCHARILLYFNGRIPKKSVVQLISALKRAPSLAAAEQMALWGSGGLYSPHQVISPRLCGFRGARDRVVG